MTPDEILAELEIADRTLREEREAIIAAALAPLTNKRDMLAFLASEAGVNVSKISEVGMHTKARREAYNAIARGAQLAADASLEEES